MTQQELTIYNLGQDLDDLMNLDPRGYGVCRILYAASRAYTKEPLTTHAAKEFIKTVKEGDFVYIITGFVLRPYKKAEMDGIVSSMLLCRALVKAFNCTPVIVVPEDNLQAVKNMAPVVGLHLYETLAEAHEIPNSMAVQVFTKDKSKAAACADAIIAQGKPSAVIAIEAPGANKKGEYHNAIGLSVTELEAKSDILFTKLQEMGVLNIAIGDLGNELGMGTIADQLDQYIPYAAEGRCNCPCGGGLASAVAADHIITATTSDFGCYGLMAAMAYLLRDIDIMQTGKLEREAIYAASRSGMIDMYGWLVPAIDGFDDDLNVNVVELMRKCVEYAIKLEKTCATWFEKTIELGYFEKV